MNLLNKNSFGTDLKIQLGGFIFLILFLFLNFHQIIFHPNSFLLCDIGVDGIKNYYLYAWVAKFGNANAMNYPFGEVILFSDSVPILSYSIYLLKSIGIDLNTYSVGILHYSMLICFPICYFGCIKLFKHFNCDPIISVLGALLITLGNPVNSRILLHFGLFYIIISPLLIYFIFKYTSTAHWKYLIYISLFNLIGYFAHGYTGTLWAATTLCIFLGLFILSNYSKKTIAIGFTSFLIPTIIYYFSVRLSDDHLWRTKHFTILYDFAISSKNIFDKLLFKNLYLFDSLQLRFYFWIFLAISLILFIRNLYIKKEIDVSVYILTISSLLFFGYGLTLFIRFDFLFKILPPLEQIRDLLRFGWIFYILILIGMLIFLHQNLNKWIIYSILILGISECYFYHKDIMKESLMKENIFSENKYELDTENIEVLYAVFNSNSISDKDPKNRFARELLYSLSYHFGIPSLNTYYSRLSFEEAHYTDQLLLPSIEYSEQLFSKINWEKNVLVITVDSLFAPHWKNISSVKTDLMYTVPISDFLPPKSSLNQLRENSILTLKKVDSLFIENNEQLIIATKANQDLMTIEIDSLVLGQNYEMSIWNYNYHQDSLNYNRLKIYQNDKMIGYNGSPERYSVLANKWGVLNIPFTPIDNSKIVLKVTRPISKSPYYYDKLFHITYEQKDREQPLIFSEINIYKK
ncbi:hypothetical protein KMW28_02580 [Flammeovirga yaeyamensis]|uniref:Uncharacterized protein n=1 Tax=Flammeovirga yaeyamensis TaxID=367791 RepID=A0AAX1N8C2_9BACT|nr:hypothetical protein [Flammeovirga yaeyamensis]MBB3700398.1 hypothetical protein [Flammeovirga yaeyamensis]NMF36976.1 hypothetical protein [Flammeovirga yaeyamensis]QWG02480.1 hypothetical protein KMW28_02580 [Flammeovirga yaeyamensis]